MRADQHGRYGKSSDILVEAFRGLLAFLTSVPCDRTTVVTNVGASIPRNDLACACAHALQDRRERCLSRATQRNRKDAMTNIYLDARSTSSLKAVVGLLLVFAMPVMTVPQNQPSACAS